MLWMIAGIFFVLWGVGFLTSYTVGGFIHILLLLALVVVLVRVIQGRRAVRKRTKA
jgi:membrane protein implicated in regulation of membrane protease activity